MGNGRNLLPTLTGPALQLQRILQQYQRTLLKRIHSPRAKTMAQHLETTDPPKHPGRHCHGHQPQSFHLQFPPLSPLMDIVQLHLIVVLAPPRQWGPGMLVNRLSASPSAMRQHLK